MAVTKKKTPKAQKGAKTGTPKFKILKGRASAMKQTEMHLQAEATVRNIKRKLSYRLTVLLTMSTFYLMVLVQDLSKP